MEEKVAKDESCSSIAARFSLLLVMWLKMQASSPSGATMSLLWLRRAVVNRQLVQILVG
jgi:hypothetical protein